MTLADLFRLKGKDKTDPDLERLLAAAKAGRSGVDLSKMSDDEIIQHLTRRAA